MKTFWAERDCTGIVTIRASKRGRGSGWVALYDWKAMFGPLPKVGAPPREYRLELVKRKKGGEFKKGRGR